MKIVIWLINYAIAIAVAALVLDGIGFGDPSSGEGEWPEKLLPLLIVSGIMGLVTVFVKPLAKLLSLPLTILTLGLFLLVVNTLMLMLTAWVAGQVDVGFYVDGFWDALLGSIIITIIITILTRLVDLVAPDD